MDWVKSELSLCVDFLHRYNGEWKDLELPYTVERNISRKGYEAGVFHLTMDQDMVRMVLPSMSCR